MKSGYLFYPRFINPVAAIIGGLRNLFNIELMLRDESFQRGERTEFVNALGVKAELIIQNYLDNTDKRYIAAPFIGRRSPEPDKILGDYRIDIKGVRADAPDLLVNIKAHRKAKDLTHYWFVQPVQDNKAYYWLYQFQEVNQWPIKDVKYTEAYYTSINKTEEEHGTRTSIEGSESIQGDFFTTLQQD